MPNGGAAVHDLPSAQPAGSQSVSAHPMNSSRLLLELISMPQRNPEGTGWDSVIHRSTMRSLMLGLQYRDPAIVAHGRRVAALAVGVAQFLGWEGRCLQTLEAASLLHDVGKIGIPDIILHKPGQLAPDELELMGLLYGIGGDVLQACGADPEVIQIVTQTQYHYNGASHEFSVIGSEVHQGARILAVIDAYDSLITRQAFRNEHSHNEAMDILARGGGSKYDGNVVSALTRWFEYNGVPDNAQANASETYQLKPEEALEAGSLSHVFSYLYMLESLYHGFFITDSTGRVRVWNHGVAAMTGVTWEQARGAGTVQNLLKYRNRHGEGLAPHETPIHLASETGRTQSRELKLQQVTGDWIDVEVQTMPLFNAAGRVQGYAEILRDQSRGRENGQYRDLKLMASRDALTHVANRGELTRQLTKHFETYHERGCQSPFSVIFLDVDHFKKTNDTYGHAAGDEVLISVARLLQHETYSGEMVARYGGEEFVVLCPETGLQDAFQKAERLRSALQNAQVVKSDEFKVTASFGVATIEPGDTAESVVQRADKALYVSKHQGRNRSTSLTSEQIRRNDASMVQPPLESPDQYVYEAKLRACVAANMIVYKLKAFVDGNKARLGEVTPERVTMKLGQKGLVPFWGATPEKQPVHVILQFGNQQGVIERGASRLIEIHVTITPLGWVRNVESFQKRCRTLLQEMREYFAADYADTEFVSDPGASV